MLCVGCLEGGGWECVVCVISLFTGLCAPQCDVVHTAIGFFTGDGHLIAITWLTTAQLHTTYREEDNTSPIKTGCASNLLHTQTLCTYTGEMEIYEARFVGHPNTNGVISFLWSHLYRIPHWSSVLTDVRSPSGLMSSVQSQP